MDTLLEGQPRATGKGVGETPEQAISKLCEKMQKELPDNIT